MTTTLVPDKPFHVSFVPYDVDKSITARDTMVLINNTSFLLGRNLEHIVECNPSPVEMMKDNNPTEVPYIAGIEWYYQRSPDVKYAVIGYEIHNTVPQWGEGAYSIKVSGSFPTGITFPTSDDELVFYNNIIAVGRLDETELTTIRGTVDVSALDPNSVYVFRLQYQGTRAHPNEHQNHSGLSKVFMQELPQTALTISGPSLSGSVDSLWTTPYRYIVDGDTNTEYGYARILDQSKQALNRVRQHWQIINHQGNDRPDLSGVWNFAGTAYTPLLFDSTGEVYDRFFWFRTRNYLGFDRATSSSYKNHYKFLVRYKTSSSTSDATLRMKWRSEANGINGSHTITLPGSTSWITQTLFIDMPCDEWAFQREQLVRMQFDGKCNSAGQQVYISAIALIENESY